MINSNSETVIEVKNVKKQFKSYKDKASSFKERFINPSRGKHEDVMVLKGISFSVKRGEAIGIIGKNGCGKSTTLKLLTRILYPNEGQITIKGRVSSLIELGAGFHPDMTGRENIYTNASIFGITKREVDKRLNDIIRFSELEEYIDNPVRTYSSGMYMRLAFAVAINVDADVLLIDEILAVGDAAFQKKCFEKLKEIKENGTTIVIVSHSMEQMYKICNRLIWLENGLIKDQGVPKFIGEAYLAAMEGKRLDRIDYENLQKREELEKQLRAEQERLQSEQEKEKKKQEEKKQTEQERKRKEEEEQKHQEEIASMERMQKQLAENEKLKDICKYYLPGARKFGGDKIKYTRVSLKNEDGNETNQLLTGNRYTLELQYEAFEKLSNIRFVLGVTRDDGTYCYGTYLDVKDKIHSKGVAVVEFDNRLLKGKYVLDLWIETLESVSLESIYSLMKIEVDTIPYLERGILTMDHEWKLKQIPGGK